MLIIAIIEGLKASNAVVHQITIHQSTPPAIKHQHGLDLAGNYRFSDWLGIELGAEKLLAV